MRIVSLRWPLLVLLYNPWQCVTDEESGDHDMQTIDSTISFIAPRCVPEQHVGDVCSFYPSPTNYEIIITNESQFIVQSLSDSIRKIRNKCNQFLAFGLCFYMYRSCELHNVSDPDSGSQLPICRNKCEGLDRLAQECNKEVLQFLFESLQNKALEDLVSLAARFMCSDPNTYIIPQVPVSNKSCDNLSYIDHLLPREGTPSAVIIGVGVGLPLLLTLSLITAVLALVLAVSKLKNRKETQALQTEMDSIDCRRRMEQTLTHMDFRSIENIELSSEEKRYYMGRFGQSMIAFAHLKMGETVGEGTFGVVCKATLENNFLTGDQLVAVKMARNISSKQELCSLLNESLLMKQFDHPNIVGLLGVCFDTPDGYPYLILPFMVNGNIRDYLKDQRVHPTNTTVLPDGFSMKILVTMCTDIAKGMEYLSCNKFIHRDLAARNCMLDEKGVVRVGDFGLARDIYSHLYYRADKFSQIPVKWSAPEVLKDGLCTEYSDVWSYGVVCWEVFSLGSTPYPGVSNHDIHQYVVNGKRVKKPPLCPRNMYAIMKSCWKLRPEERPNFKQLVSSITTP